MENNTKPTRAVVALMDRVTRMAKEAGVNITLSTCELFAATAGDEATRRNLPPEQHRGFREGAEWLFRIMERQRAKLIDPFGGEMGLEQILFPEDKEPTDERA